MTSNGRPSPGLRGEGQGGGSRSALTWAAAISAGIFAAIGIRHVDREAIAFAVLFLIALALLRFRRGLLGLVVLGLLSIDTLFWMATATVSNLQNGEAAFSVVQPLVLTITSATTLAAIAIALVRRLQAIGPRWSQIAPVAVVTFAIAFGAEAIFGSAATASSGGVSLTIHNAAYSNTRLNAQSSQVTLAVTNQDLFWHTVTIDQLHVNVAIPIGGHRDIRFSAPPGSYTFYCAIPGHRQAGMVGTITIP